MGLKDRLRRLEYAHERFEAKSPRELYEERRARLEEATHRIAEELEERERAGEPPPPPPTEEEIAALEASSNPIDWKRAEVCRIVRRVLGEEGEDSSD